MLTMKKVAAIALSSLMTVSMGMAAISPLHVFAAEEYNHDATAENVQNDRCYINGDEIRAFEIGTDFYIYAEDLVSYGFSVDMEAAPAAIEWKGTDYYYDEAYTPNVDVVGLKQASEATAGAAAKLCGQDIQLYTVEGVTCIKADDMDKIGYHVYDSEKNMMNIYVEAAGYTQNEQGYRNVTVDAGNVISELKPLQGNHYDPGAPGSPKAEVYKELGVTSIRNHDSFTPDKQGIGDIATVYIPMKHIYLPDGMNEGEEKYEKDKYISQWDPDDYDPTDWSNYDFTESDKVIKNILDNGYEVFFRFADGHHADSVPADLNDWDKYLNTYIEVAKKIIEHYQLGSDGSGFDHALSFFEFWNEPDLTDFWDGPNPDDPEDTSSRDMWYDYYAKVARAVKALDPNLPVGGPCLTTLNDDRGYREGFIKYVAENNVPLDFYSFHYYPSNNSDPYDYARTALKLKGILEENGLHDIPMAITEWDIAFMPFFVPEENQGPYTAAAMMYMQDSPIIRSYIYFSMTGWGNSTTISKKGYGYKAVSQMSETKNRLAVTGADKNGFAVLAGTNDADQINVLLTNYQLATSSMLTNDGAMGGLAQGDKFYEPSGVAVWTLPKARVMTYHNANGYNLTVNNVNYETKYAKVEKYRMDVSHNLELIDTAVVEVKDGKIELSNALTGNQVDLLKINPVDEDQAIDALEAAKADAQQKAAEAQAAAQAAAQAQRIAEQKAREAEAAQAAAEADAAAKIQAAEDAKAAAEEAQRIAEQKAAAAEKAAAAIKAPAKVSLKSVKGAKKALTVKWAKVKDAKGYEIQIATNKKFTKNAKTITVKKGSTVSKKIKKLSAKKKYYVRVRAYKTIGDGTIYGKWSSAKSKKTK